MNAENEKPEFWESAFTDKREMWGFEPATSTVLTRDLFLAHAVKTVLIPGIGYGRNAQLFREAGMEVTGIEISKTAIGLALKHLGPELRIYQGSVTEMPFDDRRYDGIFCYGLIYLLDEAERAKLIRDCYDQLQEGGHMVFTVISKAAKSYGQGKPIGTDRFEQFGGVNIFFYDRDSIQKEFGNAGLAEISEVEESHPFYMIICRK